MICDCFSELDHVQHTCLFHWWTDVFMLFTSSQAYVQHNLNHTSFAMQLVCASICANVLQFYEAQAV